MNKNYQKLIELLGENRVKTDEPMAKYTTFGIGGPADLYYEAKTEEELVRAIKKSDELEVPYYILGNGSNLLVGDKGIKGMVIKNKILKIKYKKVKGGELIIAGAGVLLNDLMKFCVKNSFSGLEFLTGIPGSVGGAVRGNAGAWQKNIGDQVKRVKILTEDGKVKWIAQEDCHFSYRKSWFKKTKEIILEVELKVEKKEKKEIEKMVGEYKEKRKNQPRELSAGSVFINPKPYSAGEMIEECGLKGIKNNLAEISLLHANFIVNLGGAKAKDVVELIALVKEKVKKRFGIELEEEIVRVGEF